MPVRAFIGADEVTDYLVGLDAPRIGPGVTGSGTLYIDKAAGGLDFRMGEEVKVYRTFNDAGAGVADRGRYFFGIIANRTTSNAVNIKQWAIPCHSYNVLTTKIVRDANTDKSIVLSADNFDAQIAALIQTIQENGSGGVAKTISTTGVADLHATMPAVTLPPGHSLGWYLAYLGNTVRTLNPAIYPAFFIDTERDFGVATSAGGACLHFYDASLMPSPLYTYANDPTGAERTWYAPPKRILTGSSVVNRRQLTFMDGEFIATYAESASGNTYPNDWINHGLNPSSGALTANAGYWMAEPLDDSEVEHWQDAEAAIRGEVQKTAYPRETIELAVAEQLYVGDVITIINDLEGISQDMRVVESKVDWSFDAVDPGSIIRCGARLIRQGEDSEGIPVPPTEGDVTPPAVPTWDNTPTDDWINQNEQEPGAEGVTLELETTLTEPGDMSHYIWRYIYQAAPIPVNARWYYARTEAADKTLTLTVQPFSTVMTIQVEAFDTAGNGSGWSATASLTTAMRRFYDYPPNMHFEPGRESGDDDSEAPFQSTYPWGWEPTENGTSTARLYAADRFDGLTCLRLFHDGSNTPAVMSGLFPVSDDTPQTYNWAGYVKGQTAGDDIVFRVYWYDENGVTVGDVAAGTADLTTSWAQFSWFVDSPGLGAKWASLHIGGGSLGASKWGQVDAMNFMQQVQGDQVQDGAITVPKLDLDVETNPLPIKDDSGTNRMEISWTPPNIILFEGVGSPAPDLLWQTGGDFSASATDFIFQAVDNFSVDADNLQIAVSRVRPATGVSIVAGAAALATSATDGFIYLPTCAGKPTGTPTTQTGTIPVVWDTTNKILWMYSAGAWLPLEGIGTSFPASPITGQKFYRSDLQRWAYYDGTRWLSEEFAIPLTQYQGSVPLSATTEYLAYAPPAGFPLYLTRFSFSFYLGANADGSNYWKAKLRNLESDGSTITALGEIQTPNGTGGAWTRTTDLTSFSNNPLEVDDIWLQLFLEKTGSPNSIYPVPGLLGRLVLG